jgi:hypothetical protein
MFVETYQWSSQRDGRRRRFGFLQKVVTHVGKAQNPGSEFFSEERNLVPDLSEEETRPKVSFALQDN